MNNNYLKRLFELGGVKPQINESIEQVSYDGELENTSDPTSVPDPYKPIGKKTRDNWIVGNSGDNPMKESWTKNQKDKTIIYSFDYRDLDQETNNQILVEFTQTNAIKWRALVSGVPVFDENYQEANEYKILKFNEDLQSIIADFAQDHKFYVLNLVFIDNKVMDTLKQFYAYAQKKLDYKISLTDNVLTLVNNKMIKESQDWTHDISPRGIVTIHHGDKSVKLDVQDSNDFLWQLQNAEPNQTQTVYQQYIHLLEGKAIDLDQERGLQKTAIQKLRFIITGQGGGLDFQDLSQQEVLSLLGTLTAILEDTGNSTLRSIRAMYLQDTE